MDDATPKERELDPRDPNDNAFILVSVLKNCAWIFLQKNHKNNYCPLTPLTQYPFNYPSKATQYNLPPTRALELSQATCERTGFYARIRRWRARQSVVESPTTTTPPSDVSSLTTPSVRTDSTSSNTDSTDRRSDRRADYLQVNMSSFTNIEKTNKAMPKRKKRSSTQFVQDAFIEKADGESDCHSQDNATINH
jgi:hypothetical protein